MNRPETELRFIPGYVIEQAWQGKSLAKKCLAAPAFVRSEAGWTPPKSFGYLSVSHCQLPECVTSTRHGPAVEDMKNSAARRHAPMLNER